MIVLLNLIVPCIILLAVFATWKTKKIWPSVVAVLVAVTYGFIQPSYMPKGEVKRSEIPAFEYSDAKIEDRNLKPDEGSDERVKAKIKSGLEFKEGE